MTWWSTPGSNPGCTPDWLPGVGPKLGPRLLLPCRPPLPQPLPLPLLWLLPARLRSWRLSSRVRLLSPEDTLMGRGGGRNMGAVGAAAGKDGHQ